MEDRNANESGRFRLGFACGSWVVSIGRVLLSGLDAANARRIEFLVSGRASPLPHRCQWWVKLRPAEPGPAGGGDARSTSASAGVSTRRALN